MNRYQFLKKTYPLRLLFGGMRERENQFYLFPVYGKTLTEICDILWEDGWGTNVLSTTFRGEIYSLWRPEGQHQYHLRLYREYAGIGIEGHYETNVQFFPAEHKDGVDLRPLNQGEIIHLRRLL